MSSRSVSDFKHSGKSSLYKSSPTENIFNLPKNNTVREKENNSSKGSDDLTQERIAEFYNKSERLLDSILKSKQEGKILQDEDVCNDIQSLDNTLGNLFSSPSPLSVKFEHGSKICSKIHEEGLVVDMWKFCVNNRENLPKISKTEQIIWGFLVIVTNFSSDISLLLAKADGFLKYGKEALTMLFGPFESKSADNLQKHTIECIVTTIHNMCISCESTISYVRAAGYLTIFLKYLCSDRLKDDLQERVTFLAAAGDIMNETDGNCVVGSREEIEYIICGLEKAIESHCGEYDGWFPFELGTVIRQLAIFDANKRMLVEHGVLRALNKLANQSEEVEQLAATKALAHLAFNEENKKSMMEEKEEEDVIQTLFNLAKSSKYSSVRESAKGVLWTLSEHLHASKKYSEEATDLFKKKTRGHVMISYSREQRPLLLRIKQILTEAGFTVWMDIEQMRENVYDRMAEAIQDASVVLISMSYSYQRSEYCRREAAYASSLKKSRVPLLVEAGYQAEGWLALMTAGDYHYDFVNKPFESKIAELKKEIGRRTYTHNELKDDFVDGQNMPDIKSNIIPSHGQPVYLNDRLTSSQSEETSKSKRRHKKFLKLPKEKVNEWLDKNDLPRHLFESYRAKDFVFLARMKEEAPETFYKHVMKLSKRKDKTAPLQLASDIAEALDHLKL